MSNNIPRELIKEITDYIPKYNCIKVKFRFTDIAYEDDEVTSIGFEIKEGERIFILDNKESEDCNTHSLDAAIENNCCILSKKAIEDDYRTSELLKHKNGWVLKYRLNGDGRRVYGGVFTSSEEFEIIERW